MNKKIIPVIACAGLLAAACIWGFAFVIVKDSLDYIPPIYMLAFRFTIAAAGLALAYRRKLFLLSAEYWRHGIALGLFLFLAYAFQTVGCRYTTAGKNAFLTTVYVVLVPVLGGPLLRRKPHPLVFFAAAMSVIGIALLTFNGGSLDTLAMNRGDALTLVCGVFYAVHILFVSKWAVSEDPILLTVLQFAFAALFSWILSPILDGAVSIEALVKPRAVCSMMYLGVMSTLAAFVLQNVGLKYVKPFLATVCLSMESVFGVLFSTVLLGEVMSAQMIAGCALMFAAVIVAQKAG